jgi:tetratricopeptide (TPR) repeat protein
MGCDQPALGVGPRGFHRYYPSYQIDQRWFSKYAHSAVLSCWAELGVPGTLLMAILGVLWLLAVGRGVGRLSGPDPEGRVGQGLRHPTSTLLDAFTACLILSLCSSVDVQWQFPSLGVTWAAWLGYALALAWPDQPTAQAAATVAADEPLSPWSLRPRVLICYVIVTMMGIGSALNLCWAFGQYYSDISEELLKRGKVAEAIDCDKRSIQLNPFQGSYYHHLGLAYTGALSRKSPTVTPAEYLKVAQRAVALDSHRAVHYDLLAKAYRTNQKPEQARKALHRALECDPVNYPSFYTMLADLASDPSERSQRERLLLTSIYRFPADALGSMFAFRSSDILRQMSESYLLLAELSDPSKPEIALGYYDELLKIQPDDLSGQLGRLVCLINLNRLKEAHKLALKVYYQYPRTETLDTLKHVYQFENLPFDPKGLPPIPVRQPVPAATGTPTPDQPK